MRKQRSQRRLPVSVRKKKSPIIPPTGKRRLTAKQRKFIQGRLTGKSSARAARDAGYSESTARKANRDILRAPVVQSVLVQLMERAGVRDRKLAKRINEGLDATYTHCATYEGKFTDKLVLVDYPERREMVELALTLKGYLYRGGRTQRRDKGPTLEELLSRSK